MPLRIPDWLRYEWAHYWDGFYRGDADEGLRERLNRCPQLVIGITILAVLVLGLAFVTLDRGGSESVVPEGIFVWFYDLNTDTLFSATANKVGPIEAPSGPLPNGELAGVRAHVYSYVLDPNRDELFVGFLDKPDPNTPRKRPTWKRNDFEKWSRYRVIKRVEDKVWVGVNSEAGQAILRALARPDAKGRTAQYHIGTGKK